MYRIVWELTLQNSFNRSFSTIISTRPQSPHEVCYHKVGQAEMEDMQVGFSGVGLRGTRVGQMVPPI